MTTRSAKTANIKIAPKATLLEEMEEVEAGDAYYVINIYDNHGTINITQSGQPDEPPPDDPGE